MPQFEGSGKRRNTLSRGCRRFASNKSPISDICEKREEKPIELQRLLPREKPRSETEFASGPDRDRRISNRHPAVNKVTAAKLCRA
jgi:hypothetical protein